MGYLIFNGLTRVIGTSQYDTAVSKSALVGNVCPVRNNVCVRKSYVLERDARKSGLRKSVTSPTSETKLVAIVRKISSKKIAVSVSLTLTLARINPTSSLFDSFKIIAIYGVTIPPG